MDKIFKIVVILLVIGLIIVLINDIYINMKMKELAAKGKSTLKTGPIQQKIKEETIEIKGVKIKKLAKYDITGIVIAKEYYYFGGGPNKISKEDLTLCWGPAAEHKDDIYVLITGNDRFVNYRISGELYRQYGEDAQNYISNNHIIPINSTINKIIKKAKKGDAIQMTGYLVYCQGDNWTWGPSSMVRTDKGNGACEIFLVENARIIKK